MCRSTADPCGASRACTASRPRGGKRAARPAAITSSRAAAKRGWCGSIAKGRWARVHRAGTCKACMPEQPMKAPVAAIDEESDLPPVLHEGSDPLPKYAELHCISNFSFQRGASHPQELVRRAYDLGYEALAITDECSVAGVVRAWSGWNDYRAFIRKLDEASPDEKRLREFRLLFGSEFDMGDGRLVALACDLESWGGLCQFITDARMGDSKKGEYRVEWSTRHAGLDPASSDISLLDGCQILFAPKRGSLDIHRLRMVREQFGDNLCLAVELPGLIV